MKWMKYKGFARISRARAKKAYNKGATIWVVPAKCFPDKTEWVDAGVFTEKKDGPFENVVNRYEFMNCTDLELGKYAAFYIKEEDLNNEKD